MLFIHIGFHKTGSTTIQGFAARAAVQLSRAGIQYPEIGRTNAAHFNLVEELRESPMFLEKRGTLGELRRLIEAEPDSNYLLSSEGFHLLDLGAVRRLKDELPSVDVRVLAYLRDLPTMVVSSYLQVAKTGAYLDDFDSFFARRMRADRAQEPVIREFDELNNWGQVFGWESLRVRMLHPDHLAEGDLLTDFVHALGLNWSDLGEVPDQSLKGRNVSPGWKTVELLRSMHAAAGDYAGQQHNQAFRQIRRGAQIIRAAGEKIGEELGLNEERGRYLTESQWETCLNVDRELKRRLEERCPGKPFPQLDSNSYRPRSFMPEASRVPPDERGAFYEKMSLALVEALRAISEGEGLARRLRVAGGEELGPLSQQAKARRQATRREERLARKRERQGRKEERVAPAAGEAAAVPADR